MDYSNFLYMRDELSLIVVLVAVLLYDIISGKKGRSYFQPVAIGVFAIHTAISFFPHTAGVAFGGMYVFSPIMGIVKSILNIATLVIFLQSKNWIDNPKQSCKQGEFYFLTISTLLGMYFMISSGNFLIFYIGLEMASIPMASLIAIDKYSVKSAEAGAKYILLAAFSSGILLFGVSLIYGATGTLYFENIPAQLNHLSYLQLLAFLFFVAGLFFKISLVPFHMWTPDVYEGAQTNITAYLSVVSKGSAVFVLMIILYKVFAPFIIEWQYILYGIILFSITLANIFAIRQQNIKRFMAYSSISQAGYIVLGIIGGNPLGMTALVFYILVYVLSNLGLFGVISSVEQRTNKINISDYNGFYSTNPKLSFVMTIALFSLAGIPPLAGFFSKFFIFAAATAQGYYILVLIALINTIISLYYYLKLVRAMFIEKNDTPIEKLKTDVYNKISLILCTIGVIVVGFISNIFDYINNFSFGVF